MSVFTFTVNCPASPTPTPTPTPTPLPWCCRLYSVTNNTSNTCTINYTTCNNTATSTSAGPFATVFLGCVREGTITSACSITINTIGACNNPNNTCAQTPTPTPTPSPTPTSPPTPTPLPTYTVTVYASLQAIPDAIIPPGSGTEPNARVYYWLGAPTVLTLLGGNISSTSCNLVGTVSGIPEGTVFTIGMRSWSYNTPIFFIPNLGSSTCITTPGVTAYCGTAYDPGGGFSFTVTSNTTIALTARTVQVVDSTVRRGSTRWNGYKYEPYAFELPIYKTSLYYCNNWTPNQF